MIKTELQTAADKLVREIFGVRALPLAVFLIVIVIVSLFYYAIQ